MAQYDGYRTIPHATYDEWRSATYGNGYNVDYAYGNQCWDFCALLYWQYNLTLVTGSPGYAKNCWIQSRDKNAVDPFSAITDKTDIKRGDIVVFNSIGSSITGHIAFADEDYSGDTLQIFGQNQGQGIYGGSNVISKNLSTFLGAFRNANWQNVPPTPTTTTKKKDFPWPVAWAHWDNFKR